MALHPGARLRQLSEIDDFFISIDDRLRDTMFKWRGPQPRPDAPILIADIDEKSMAAFGQWPWPRNIMAEIVRRLDACGPKAIGFDIVFAEPDRTSLARALPPLAMLAGKASESDKDWHRLPAEEQLATAKRLFGEIFGPEHLPPDPALDHDLDFVEVIRQTPRAVLGFFFKMEDDGLKDPQNPPVPYGAGIFVARTPPGTKYSSPFQRRGAIPYRPVLNFPLLDEAAEERCGCFNCGIRDSGIVRRVPLIWEYE
ncbi:MAG: CHASE2 domain-containing protein, partial [Planctomycetota bacterium]|nr:CHASE2 domain-containing protein [Planctomycetota bacterium]